MSTTPRCTPLMRVAALAAMASAIVTAGCGGSTDKNAGRRPVDPHDFATAKVYPALEGTIGQYAFFADNQPMPVEGWGIVAGLPHTGSGEMNPDVRAYLRDQLYRANAGSYAKGTENYNPERILASDQIAAVEVHGVIPPLARRGDVFDLTIKALPDTQTTSLAGGLLWTSPLKVIGLRTDIDTKPIAVGRGPVFIPDKLNAESADPTKAKLSGKALRSGRVIGGGIVTEDRSVRLELRSPSNRFTAAILRAINSRFPGREKVADAISDQIININIPPEFSASPARFMNLIGSMYLTQDMPGFAESQAGKIIKSFEDPKAPHAELSLALEGLGRSVLIDYIEPQYTSPNPAVRFWSARAGAALQDVGGLVVLEETLKDPKSPFRIQALQGIIDASRGINGDTVRATVALSSLLESSNINDRLMAYGALVAIRSRAVHSYTVAKKFIIDIVPCDGPLLVYATQSDMPRVALIGHNFSLPAGSLYISPDNLLTVNVLESSPPTDAVSVTSADPNVVTATAMTPATPDQAPEAPKKEKEAVTLYWRAPSGGRTVTLKTSSNLADILARLGWSPDPLSHDFDPDVQYIGLSYQRLVEMLSGMCGDQVLNAKFVLQKANEPTFLSSDALAGRPEGSTEHPVVHSAPPEALNGPANPPTTAPAP